MDLCAFCRHRKGASMSGGALSLSLVILVLSPPCILFLPYLLPVVTFSLYVTFYYFLQNPPRFSSLACKPAKGTHCPPPKSSTGLMESWRVLRVIKAKQRAELALKEVPIQLSAFPVTCTTVRPMTRGRGVYEEALKFRIYYVPNTMSTISDT